ncbi:MAG: hypothetical protein M1812_007967 [Candelaria pacifica]|nr:MAG: hypothetical protein M1812_007967 [Candelaria pacifica]
MSGSRIIQIAQCALPKNGPALKARTYKASGVYALVNKINGKSYIGSAVYLSNRILDYQQQAYLASKSTLVIVRAIQKHGFNSFDIYLLEYTSLSDLRTAEQSWLDFYKPEYNTLKLVDSSQEYKHTPESLAKISAARTGKKLTDEQRAIRSMRQIGTSNSFYGHNHTSSNVFAHMHWLRRYYRTLVLLSKCLTQ